MIFDQEQIQSALVYGELMVDLNELHDSLGAPGMAVRGPTTDNAGFDAHEGQQWSPDSLGDWGDTDVNVVSKLLQEEYETVLNAINRGRYPYYYSQGEAWDEFERQALDLVDDFNVERAWVIASQENFERIEAAAKVN